VTALTLWLALAGCGEIAEIAETAAPAPGETAAPSLDTGLCATAPIATWDNFGAGFMTGACQTCHASTTANRNGAPVEITFDTEAEAWALADRILARATGPEPTMPPAGGVSDDDRYLLEVWLTCDSP
jgi:uncharacterized membrane protein